MAQKAISHMALSDNGFLFDTTTGFTYTLNSVGTTILKGLIAGQEIDDILDAIVEEFDISFDVASRDAEMFLNRLRELGLIATEE